MGQNARNFIIEMNDVGVIIYVLKLILISLLSYYTSFKIINKKEKLSKNILCNIVIILFINIICGIIKYKTNSLTSILTLILSISFVFVKTINCELGFAILIQLISFSINCILFLLVSVLSFVPVIIFDVKNIYLSFLFIFIAYIVILFMFLKIKRVRNGLIFLQKTAGNDYMNLTLLNICVILLFSYILFSVYKESITDKIGYALIIFAIIMFITIQKSLQIYYKQKLLVQELEETKNELEKKNKEIKELEQENLNFSKTSHTLAHKQKALEYKLNQLINQSAKNEPTKNNTNVSREDNITHQANKPENIETEQIQDIKERLAEISKDLYQNEKSTRLAQTGIKRIDDMLKYMQSESEKYNIKLELQITGNIHHMTNKIIEEKDLETLIADHVKNAIIAINHSKNENKSILVKLGKIEENYGLAIFDTGIEFENETLENLGKKPSTTHAEEGGTGMGFMNTFDTINKYKASLIINEIGKESETNYTKAIIIKFDQKNEFKIDSYRQQKSTRTAKK